MSGPGDEQQPPQWQQPQWQQPQQPSESQPPQQQQWGGQQQPWGSQPPYQPAGQTPGSATAALILGICAILVCPLICAPLALVYGNKAKNEIDASGGRLGGRGMAVAGIVMGWIGVALIVLGVILFAAGAASS